MNGDERDRIAALNDRIIKVEIQLDQILQQSQENRKALRGIFASITVGVCVLLISIIVTKIIQ